MTELRKAWRLFLDELAASLRIPEVTRWIERRTHRRPGQ